jgi:hypothetical protein
VNLDVDDTLGFCQNEQLDSRRRRRAGYLVWFGDCLGDAPAPATLAGGVGAGAICPINCLIRLRDLYTCAIVGDSRESIAYK